LLGKRGGFRVKRNRSFGVDDWTRFRHDFLGREPHPDKHDPDAIREFIYLCETGNLSAVVRTWIESPEFVKRIPTNDLFSNLTYAGKSQETQTLLHLHVPKTGGTTVNLCLRDAFLDGESIIHPSLEYLSSFPLAYIGRVPFIASHFAALLIPLRAAFSQSFTFCILRNPIDAVPSYFHYSQEMGRLPAELQFEDFLDDARYWNYQAQALTQDSRLDVDARDGKPLPNLGVADVHQFREIENPDRLYVLARDRRDSLDHVGLTDHIDATLNILSAWLGEGRQLGRLPRQNVGHDRSALSKSIQTKIARNNEVDLTLYAEVQALL
jgi:hypothetical protein